MKNNTFKRVLAGSLALLTVAAYVPANVGGILPDLSIVASADSTPSYTQQGGLLRVDEDSVAYIDGLYVLSTDAGKTVYTSVSGTDVFTLADGKQYVLRTKAYVTDGESNDYLDESKVRTKDLNGDDLAEGTYEYDIAQVAKEATCNVTTRKETLKVAGVDLFQEYVTVEQNGKEIIYDDKKTGYVVAQGFPVEFSAKPAENHTNMMLALGTGVNGKVKSQTKAADGTLTLTFVLNNTADTEAAIEWADYTPTLVLTNDNGTIKATDVGFNKLVENAVVGNYEFKYGVQGTNSFVNANTNAKGQYIAQTGAMAYSSFTAQNATAGNTTYTFFTNIAQNRETYVVEKLEDDGKWYDKASKGTGAAYTQASTKDAGTWRVTTTIDADALAKGSDSKAFANLSEPLKIVTEFTVVAQNVTSVKNLAFVVDNVGADTYVETQPENGVYKVAWQNGDEITPNLYLFKDEAKKTAAAATKYANPATNDKMTYDNGDTVGTMYKPSTDGGKTGDYYVTGTTKASEAGVYEIIITPINKAFNDGEEIVITWQIVNTNNYVEQKKVPSKQSNDKYVNETMSNDDEAKAKLVEQAETNAQNFTIGYRQATSKTILEKIIKSLNFVGSQDLTVVKYETVEWQQTKGGFADGELAEVELNTDFRSKEVDDPSENAGFYVAYVANALKNDGKTGAMVKDGKVYSGTNVDNKTGLYKVYFQVTKTRVRIVPDVTEVTYGDDVKLSELYTVIDADSKEKIGVPWAADGAPKFTLIDKYSEKNVLGATGSTKEVPAGEYVYGIADGVETLDTDNYDVRELLAEDQTDFTVKPRDLSEMDFGVVNVPVDDAKTNVVIDKLMLAEAANAIEANPVDFAYTYKEGFAPSDENPIGSVTEKTNRLGTNDFNISGGKTSAKVADLGKTFTVTIKGIKNFTGSKTISWKVGGDVLSDKVMSYEAEFDASKPRVMAKFNLNEVQDEIAECGFYYNNNGKMNDVDLADAAEYLKEVDLTGANVNQKGSKKIGFSAKAIASAKSGKGILTAEIANSSVKKQVYIMPYVKYTNGTVAYGEAESFNYYDMVLAAEGALKVTKTDFVGDGKIGTAGQTYVKVDVTRVDKKGYEVERYGIVYNNTDAWNTEGTNAKDAKVDIAEMAKAYNWLKLDYESEKTVKVAEVAPEDLATKIGTNTYIANTTAKVESNGKVTKDYGIGAKSVLAKAFIKIKDAAGNEKVYYSHLADVTYGGFTVNTTTGAINGVETKGSVADAVTDSKNTTQIMFYAPTDAKQKVELAPDATSQNYIDDKKGVSVLDTANVNGSEMTRMSASTGNKTFFVDWTDSKKS